MIVDTHAHYLPQAMLEDLNNRGSDFPNIDCLNEDNIWKLGFSGGPLTRPILPGLRQSDTRLQWMDDQKIDAMVCGGWLDSFGYEIPDEEGKRWSQFINEHLMKACSETDRFAPLCRVPLQNGKMAAAVLEEALDAGFHGAMIGTQPKGGEGNLDDPDLDPFWEVASDRKAAIYLHPMFGCGDPRLNEFALTNAVGRGTDTTTAVSRLLFSGHFLKYSGMKFVLSHGGGAIPYMMGRLAKNYDIHPGQYSDPVASFAKLYFDSVLFAPEALTFLCSSCGHDKVMLGSDYPFPIGDMTPLKVIDASGFTDSQRNMIVGETAAKLFGIS